MPRVRGEDGCSEQHKPFPATDMVGSHMMMIPGAWEPRPRSGAVVEPLASAPRRPADSTGGNESGRDTQRAELPSWLKVSIFAATLLAATLLVMTVF
jgi:hypothetical protein